MRSFLSTYFLEQVDTFFDIEDVLSDDGVVGGNVQIQDVVVDQAEDHLTGQLSRRHAELRQLLLGQRVQLRSDVQVRSVVRVRRVSLEEQRGDTEVREEGGKGSHSSGRSECNGTYIVRGEAERNGGNSGESQEGIRGVVHLHGFDSGKGKEVD